MEKTLLVVGNIIVIAILTGLAIFFEWMGPGYALGFGTGAISFFVYARIKLGRWI